jgi:hypothetical protein
VDSLNCAIRDTICRDLLLPDLPLDSAAYGGSALEGSRNESNSRGDRFARASGGVTSSALLQGGQWLGTVAYRRVDGNHRQPVIEYWKQENARVRPSSGP